MIMSLKQKKIKFNPRIKLNHNTFNPSRSIKHFYVVHWSGPEDDSILIFSELTAMIDSKKSFSFHEMINFIAHWW